MLVINLFKRAHSSNNLYRSEINQLHLPQWRGRFIFNTQVHREFPDAWLLMNVYYTYNEILGFCSRVIHQNFWSTLRSWRIRRSRCLHLVLVALLQRGNSCIVEILV